MGIAANWSRENIAWAAGLFEGEGSIYATPEEKIALQIVMTDEDVLRKFHFIIGCGAFYGPYTREYKFYKPYWTWSCSGSEKCQAILAALWCYLGVRRQEKARQAIIQLSSS